MRVILPTNQLSGHAGTVHYVWITPRGLAYLVDHLGTHRIHPDNALQILDAPPGVDLYFA